MTYRSVYIFTLTISVDLLYTYLVKQEPATLVAAWYSRKAPGILADYNTDHHVESLSLDMTYPTSGLADSQNSAAKGIGPRTAAVEEIAKTIPIDAWHEEIVTSPRQAPYWS
ncbi:hypothetical protein FG05_35248 [Fusarium graminearum]|nr:hypothetical protein FG05_35248 [Fusarium graminearum]